VALYALSMFKDNGEPEPIARTGEKGPRWCYES
jgi:hypothetical protein